MPSLLGSFFRRKRLIGFQVLLHSIDTLTARAEVTEDIGASVPPADKLPETFCSYSAF